MTQTQSRILRVLFVLIIAAIVVLLIVFAGKGQTVEASEQCFAAKTASMIPTQDGSQAYDYQFLRIDMNGDAFTGTLETYPFATDASQGTVEGSVVSEEAGTRTLQMMYHWNAEGMTGTNEHAAELNEMMARIGYGPLDQDEDGVWRYTDEGVTGYWEIPRVSCDQYDLTYSEYKTPRNY